MKEHPMIFSTESVKAILNSTKTMTRRVIKPQPVLIGGQILNWKDNNIATLNLATFHCPYGQVGDRLWVREKYAFCIPDDRTARALYTDETYQDISLDKYDKTKLGWHPSIHMPRWASRITLEITEVRVERVQEITTSDILLEGEQTLYLFELLWDSLNAKRGHSWMTNPWCWVISFKRIDDNPVKRSRAIVGATLTKENRNIAYNILKAQGRELK